MKTAIVTGLTGQMAYFLVNKLLDKDYKVIGLCRHTTNISEKLKDRKHFFENKNFIFETFDLCDVTSIEEVVKKYSPDVFFNCAAMSYVQESWVTPVSTINVTGVGVVNCLEAIRKHKKDCKFVQCSSSEMFGYIDGGKINENSQLLPRSPYGLAKTVGHNAVRVYRDSYGMNAASVIMFNYESEKRGENFFTRKITLGMRDIIQGNKEFIELGNLNFVRDWGYAGDYANALILVGESDILEDYVVSTEKSTTGKEFIDLCFKYGNEKLRQNYFCFNRHIRHNTETFMRPNDLTYLCGDSSKIRTKLGWTSFFDVEKLARTMVNYDLENK